MNSYDLKRMIEEVKKQTARSILDIIENYEFELAIIEIKKLAEGEK